MNALARIKVSEVRRFILRSKIDPKRPHDKMKNNFDEHRTRRGEKKSSRDDKQRQDEL